MGRIWLAGELQFMLLPYGRKKERVNVGASARKKKERLLGKISF